MPGVRTGLVDIVRDFLDAHERVRRLFARFRSGELRFEELELLVSDDETSVLFRIKECCHTLFRAGSGVVPHREALFDLAVGSLFHEAMKFRENFYQREVYGPRVRALRSEAGGESDALIREFERILAAGSLRLEEGLQETEALLGRTREQLRVLLREHRENGLVTRYLVENRELVEAVFPLDLEALLAEIHGAAASGYAVAGRSYLKSGHFDEALEAFGAAIERGGSDEEYGPHADYARGMSAYLARDYADAIEKLGLWLDAGGAEGGRLTQLARAAVSRVGQLVPGGAGDPVIADAAALLERLGPPDPATAEGPPGGSA
jgi:tetratricopeptide (TPR) repeat protein